MRELGSGFRPRKTRAEARAEGWAGLAGVVGFLCVMACALAALTLLPTALPQALAPLRAWLLTTLTERGVALGAAAALVLLALTVLINVLLGRSARSSRRQAKRALASAAYAGAADAINKRREQEERRNAREEEDAQRQAQRQAQRERTYTAVRPTSGGFAGAAPAPAARTGEVTPKEAEVIAAEWMRHLGEPSATTTQASWDGGIDVEGHFYIAQVKHYQGNVGTRAIREFVGVVHGDPRGRKGLYFTSNGYASGAIDFASSVGLALFKYNAWEGTIAAMNPPAKQLLQTGLGPR